MTEPLSRRRRILVIEDEHLIADFLQESLQNAGADVLGPLGSVPEVLEYLAKTDGSIDLAVLDVNLRGEWAFPVAEALRMRRIPFVFMTGYSEAAIPKIYRDVPRFEKPVDTDEILRVIGLAPTP